MATDTENLLADRFREIRQEWALKPGETETQAQNKALAPLHAWLRTGVDSPELIVRAVQVLMADPERPGIHKRPAINYVVKQISKFWESAGFREQDVLILRGMLLAAWPRDLGWGGFALQPLLDSAWVGIQGRISNEKHLEEWRSRLSNDPQALQSDIPSTRSVAAALFAKTQVPDFSSMREKLSKTKARTRANAHFIVTTDSQETVDLSQWISVFEQQHQLIAQLANQQNASHDVLQQLSDQLSELPTLLQEQLGMRTPELDQVDLLWWGQARYSNIKRQPYRRISDPTERLWWMSWESSELAMDLEVEPAASFLVENVYQIDKRAADQKRPLKQWLTELIGTLQRIHAEGHHSEAISMSEPLEKLAQADALGLPVTWARLKAAKPRPDTGDLEECIREDVAVDPDTLIDLGDWAAWIFRESLLDRHLGGQ